MRSTLYLLTWCIFISAIDQITSVPFRTIFLDASDDEILELQNSINLQNTTEQAYQVLGDWTDKVYGKPTGVSVAAKSLAVSFLEHRLGVKDYIHYMKGATRSLRYLDEQQISIMESRFWKVDKMCFNIFWCTEHNFLDGINLELQTYHQNVTRDLTEIAQMAHVFPEISDKLAFILER